MHTVHLRVSDGASGRPTPVRLRIVGPDGTVYFPFGSHHRFPTGRNEDVGGRVRVGPEEWVYIDGGCEIRLPAGEPLRVRALKGPEYEPLDATVTLGAGQLSLRFSVRRWSDVRSEGWHPGDMRVHFIPPHAAALEAAAEDVSVVNLLACETAIPGQDGHLYSSPPHLLAFSGQRPALEANSALVAVNTLNVHRVLGKVGLHFSHRVIFPLAFGGPDYPDDWSVCDWCDQCHRKNGLAVWVDPFDPSGMLSGGEALIALILGKIDAIEVDGQPRKRPLLPHVYDLWSAGFLVPLVGGSGKDSNRLPLGYHRTYARLPDGESLNYAGWVEAVRAGLCFVSNGPLLRFTVEPNDPLRFRANADSAFPFDRMEVIADGAVIKVIEASGTGGRWSATVEFEHPKGQSGWLAARVIGPPSPLADQPAFAHSAPVFSGKSGIRSPEAVGRLMAAVEQTRDWIEQHGRFTDEKWRRHLLGLSAVALAKLDGTGGVS